MYFNYVVRDTIRVPPVELGGDLTKTLLVEARKSYEGLMDDDTGVVVAILGVDNMGDGRIVPGDGAVYFEADISMLAYRPKVHELVEGEISDVTEFGAFVKTGPLEGLIHVSQIMDDYINYDAKLPGFVGKESKRRLVTKDIVKARIVTVSLKGTISSSKVGLTMRQEGLGKDDWPALAEKGKKKGKESKESKESKDSKEKEKKVDKK
jgi:DNA-directed RNA polymerase subunit E'